MKYKVLYPKKSYILMTMILTLCFASCLIWLLLREFIAFLIYMGITLFLTYIYYFKYYLLNDRYLIINYGFFKLKFQYTNIINIDILGDKLKIYFNRFTLDIYPKNKELFSMDLKRRMEKK